MEEKRTNQELVDGIRSFKDQPFFLFVYKKTERLGSAVYMVSEFFPEQEPLKTQLRESALLLLTLVLNFQDRNSPLNIQNSYYDDFVRTSIKVISLCHIGFLTRLISSMNFDVLEKEFRILIELIEDHKNASSKEENRLVLGSDFFGEALYTPPYKEVPREKEFNKGQSIGHKGQ